MGSLPEYLLTSKKVRKQRNSYLWVVGSWACSTLPWVGGLEGPRRQNSRPTLVTKLITLENEFSNLALQCPWPSVPSLSIPVSEHTHPWALLCNTATLAQSPGKAALCLVQVTEKLQLVLCVELSLWNLEKEPVAESSVEGRACWLNTWEVERQGDQDFWDYPLLVNLRPAWAIQES